MGQTLSINKINFKDMQYAINNNLIIINTLERNNQDCLIKNTLLPDEEVQYIDSCINTNKDIKIVVYGENCTDQKLIKKYNQLIQLGFKNIYVYVGGLFEWLLLQDIYGDDEFPTTTKIINLLKYSGNRIESMKTVYYLHA
jgi:hypothetical protein